VALARLDIPEEYISNILSTIDKSEFARFAPQDGTSEMEDLYNFSMNVITNLEGKLK
jgi:hypothetical protein